MRERSCAQFPNFFRTTQSSGVGPSTVSSRSPVLVLHFRELYLAYQRGIEGPRTYSQLLFRRGTITAFEFPSDAGLSLVRSNAESRHAESYPESEVSSKWVLSDNYFFPRSKFFLVKFRLPSILLSAVSSGKDRAKPYNYEPSVGIFTPM